MATAVVLVALAPACRGSRQQEPPPKDHVSLRAARAKINFDLDDLDERGLYGPQDGLRALNYELCVPDDSQRIEEVRSIDPTIQVFPGGRGRIGCSDGRILCVGSTHQSGFRTVLMRLARLPYVERIDQSFFE